MFNTDYVSRNPRSFKKSKITIKEKYIDKIMEFLINGIYTVKTTDFTEVYQIIMDETDANDNSKELHAYSKEIMRDFCKNKILK